jgi:hypothetical protein
LNLAADTIQAKLPKVLTHHHLPTRTARDQGLIRNVPRDHYEARADHDRWPEAIDAALLARYARALANDALEFAQQAR